MSFAQNKEDMCSDDGFKINFDTLQVCKECRLSEGKCKVVIEFLRHTQGNDSIAIEIFKKEYIIVSNMYYNEKERLFKKNYKEIIQYFNLNETHYCRSKVFKFFDPVLLVDI